MRDHPIHAEYKSAANKFKEVMTETRSQDWTDWLEGASQQDLYLANKYIASEPTDFSNVWISPLHTFTNSLPDVADNNMKKVQVLAESFFPPYQVYPTCQIPKFCKVIEVMRFGIVIWRVRSQGKGIASLDGSDGNAAST